MKGPRTILLTHLAKCEDVYKPHNLDTLNERIANHTTENEKLEKEIEEVKKKTQEQEAKMQREINEVRERGDRQTRQLQLEKESQIREIRESGENQMRYLREQNSRVEEQIRQLRMGIGISDETISSVLDSFYCLSAVHSSHYPTWSDRTTVEKIQYLKSEFIRVVREKEEAEQEARVEYYPEWYYDEWL